MYTRYRLAHNSNSVKSCPCQYLRNYYLLSTFERLHPPSLLLTKQTGKCLCQGRSLLLAELGLQSTLHGSWLNVIFIILDQGSFSLFHGEGNSSTALSEQQMDFFTAALQRPQGATRIVVSTVLCILVNNLGKVVKSMLIKSVYGPKWRGIINPTNDSDVT